MKLYRVLIPALAATLLIPTARAKEPPKLTVASSQVIYEGLDSQGQVVRVTVTKQPDAGGVRTVVIPQPRFPELHWSAHFASGQAADFEKKSP